jgi:hypothetical protein
MPENYSMQGVVRAPRCFCFAYLDAVCLSHATVLTTFMHAHAPHATRTPFYSSPAFLFTPLSPLIPQNPRWIGGVELSSRQPRTWANRQKMPGSGVFRSQRGLRLIVSCLTFAGSMQSAPILGAEEALCVTIIFGK